MTYVYVKTHLIHYSSYLDDMKARAYVIARQIILGLPLLLAPNYAIGFHTASHKTR